jgi:hypothetical protein
MNRVGVLDETIKSIKSRISVEGMGGSEAFMFKLQNRISDYADRMSSDIVRSCPAIHFAFSDRDNDPEFNLSPPVAAKMNGHLKEFATINKVMLGTNFVRDALSPETLSSLGKMIELSEMLKSHGFCGLQSIRRMDEFSIEIVMSPFFDADSERLNELDPGL